MGKIIKYLLITIVGISVFFLWGLIGCVVPVSKKDKNWIPYTVGETVFFKSTEGKQDSVYINDIRIGSQSGIAGFIRPQSIKVYATRNDLIIPAFDHMNEVRETHFSLFSVMTNTPFHNKQQFNFGIKDFRTGWEIDEMESRERDSLIVHNYIMKNVFVLEESLKFYPTTNSSDIKNIFWNKKEGLIGYIQYDGVLWLKQGANTVKKKL